LPVSSQNEELIREWMVRFGVNYRQEIDSACIALWQDELADIPSDRLEKLFREVIRMCRFFPNVADVRAQIANAEEHAFALKAEEAWQHLLSYAREWYHPDVDLSHRAPGLPAAVAHAARAAGGLHLIWGCPETELQWAKKRFIEDFVRIHETRQVEHLLTDGEARSLLRQIAADSQSGGQALPAPEQICSEPSDGKLGRAKQETRLNSAPVPDKSENDRFAEIRQQKEILIAKGYLPFEQKKSPETHPEAI